MSKKISLSEQLKQAENDAMYYRGKYENEHAARVELQEKLDKMSRGTIEVLNSNYNDIILANKQFMEIIRWQINPETTKNTEAGKTKCYRCGGRLDDNGYCLNHGNVGGIR